MKNRLYEEFPELRYLTDVELKQLCKNARLSRDDTRIAILRLADMRSYADIGAKVNRDRSGVSKRLRKTIVPELKKHIA